MFADDARAIDRELEDDRRLRLLARITVSATIGLNVITCVVSISAMTSIVSGGSATRSRKETVPLIAGG